MNDVKNRKTAAENLGTFLAALPRPGRELTSADVEEGQRSRQALLDGGSASVPALLSRLSDPDFGVKDICYDLILEIGDPARQTLYRELQERGPVVDLWIAAMLQHLGDESAMDRIRPYLQHPDDYVRHLTALALAFQKPDSPTPPDEELASLLVDALRDEQSIEGTPFTVAGSALACLTRMSGENFLYPLREIQFYNYEHFLYPPPLHPFPFAADHFTKAGEEEKRGIRQRVEAWLARRSAPTPL
jgi:hypothetical protein